MHNRGISDSFMGLILVPVVEKFSEHITAMDEAYDNQMNFALSHVLGASIQTALLNTPLVVLVGWGLNKDMSLNFEMFDAIVLILAIIVVGNFLRDERATTSKARCASLCTCSSRSVRGITRIRLLVRRLLVVMLKEVTRRG